MVHSVQIDQAHPSYSMLQHIERVATTKFVSRNCLRHLKTTLIMGEWGLVSEFKLGIIDCLIVLMMLIQL